MTDIDAEMQKQPENRDLAVMIDLIRAATNYGVEIGDVTQDEADLIFKEMSDTWNKETGNGLRP